MSAIASQITGVSIVCSTVCSGADKRKHQSSASPAFVRGIHRSPVDSPHEGSVARKMFLFDNNTWWRHQMETFSAILAICAGNSPVPVNSPHKGQWHGTLMFSLIYTRINGWVNTSEAGDLIRHRAHYDVTLMMMIKLAILRLISMITSCLNAIRCEWHNAPLMINQHWIW